MHDSPQQHGVTQKKIPPMKPTKLVARDLLPHSNTLFDFSQGKIAAPYHDNNSRQKNTTYVLCICVCLSPARTNERENF